MAQLEFYDTKLSGLKIVRPFLAEDKRGFFMKAFEKSVFEQLGYENDISETFESYSVKGVIRGLHFQTGAYAQAKLVRVLRGEVFDVCVDIRKDSPTSGEYIGEYLNEDNHKALYIPRGFAHGFLATKEALMSYTCIGAHQPGAENGIIYNDPDLGIKWPLTNMEVIISDRDMQLKSFRQYQESVCD